MKNVFELQENTQIGGNIESSEERIMQRLNGTTDRLKSSLSDFGRTKKRFY